MANPISLLVHRFGWIHLSLGLLGNTSFFVGSALFLPSFDQWKTTGVWLFGIGAAYMLIGALGRLLVDILEEPE